MHAELERRRGQATGAPAPVADDPPTVAAATEPAPDARATAPRRLPSRVAVGLGAAAITAGSFTAGALLLGGGDERAAGTPLPAVARNPVQPAAGQGGRGTLAGAVYAKASPAVVAITTGSGSGTGFLIDRDGTLVTNAHVVESASRVTVRFGAQGRRLSGEVLGSDPSSDLAVVRLNRSEVPRGVTPLPFADSRNVHIGDLAVAVGNPFGLDRTATEGIVSGLGREIRAPNGFQIDDAIQTDAPINPGNSGGPLLDESAHVIGVNSQIATAGAGGGNVGIGFAVPSNTVRQVVPELARGRTIERAWLGVQTAAVPSGDGARIAATVANGPAERAGVQQGDVVVAIDGVRVIDPADVSRIVNAQRAGDTISLRVQRGGQEIPIRVRLGVRPASTP